MKLLSPRRSTAWVLILVFGPGLLLTGCTSVERAPFTEFASSLEVLRAGVDTQAKSAAESSRADLNQKVAAGEVEIPDLMLSFDASDAFAANYVSFEDDGSDPEPLFVKMVRFRQGLSDLNEALLAYARSLVVLSGGDKGGDILPTSAEFNKMAKNLNDNARTAGNALGVGSDSGTTALLSTVAIQLFKAYIENERSEALGQAITEVQPQIDEFSTAAQQAVSLLASVVKTDYAKEFLDVARKSPRKATPILALNETTLATLATLRLLSNNYAALPSAHRDLAAAASNKTTGLAGLIAFNNEAFRLKESVARLAKANEAAAK